MNTSDFFEKKNILDNFNKGKFEKVIKLAKKLLKKITIFNYYMRKCKLFNAKQICRSRKFFKKIVILKPNAENNYIYGNIQKN